MRKFTHLPLRVRWRSSPLVTHGDVWLPFLLPFPLSSLPINSSCGLRCPLSWAVTAGRPGCTPSPTWACFLRWCTDQDLDPLAAARVDVERYVRWSAFDARVVNVIHVPAGRSWGAGPSCMSHRSTTTSVATRDQNVSTPGLYRWKAILHRPEIAR
jgi:hypothetical protein